jgi:hypothetical protein
VRAGIPGAAMNRVVIGEGKFVNQSRYANDPIHYDGGKSIPLLADRIGEFPVSVPRIMTDLHKALC